MSCWNPRVSVQLTNVCLRLCTLVQDANGKPLHISHKAKGKSCGKAKRYPAPVDKTCKSVMRYVMKGSLCDLCCFQKCGKSVKIFAKADSYFSKNVKIEWIGVHLAWQQWRTNGNHVIIHYLINVMYEIYTCKEWYCDICHIYRVKISHVLILSIY